MAGKKLKFPSPGDVKLKESFAMIDADRVLAIYNQDHPSKKPMERITGKVKSHSDHLAQQAGWAGTAHVKDAMTGHSGGLVLIMPDQTVSVNIQIIAPKGKPPGEVVGEA